jgi:hypothetical protein
VFFPLGGHDRFSSSRRFSFLLIIVEGFDPAGEYCWPVSTATEVSNSAGAFACVTFQGLRADD